ncbi:class I SAM-dependent methyltransferase [Saccharothrix saharensis]|uniref:class I SAM-dependent methyltransferase n=1 Tax=Saccharothrix saharensis TaxID=571190 RepID=UPI0036789670
MSLQGDELTTLVDKVMSTVDRTIAENDSMYGGNDEHYFGVGRDALRATLDALHGAGRPAPARVLDFGSGYGRVMRTFRAAFPDAELIACDLDPAAVARCVEAYGATPMAASVDVDLIEQVHDVDLIWCGSVLTHLDAPQWTPVLRYFSRALKPGGIAVVTTHGRRVAWRMENVAERTYGLTEPVLNRVLAAYYAAGFGYGDYPGQDGYGISLSKPGWAADKVLEAPDLRLVGYREAAWDQHQDVLVLAKDANAMLKVHR